MSNYRFFISYQHEDTEIAKEVERVLKEMGHCPYRDTIEGVPGVGITPQIKKAISRVHFLILIIANNSIWDSQWVQQEIGFGLACNVPVVPILISTSPNLRGMIKDVFPIEVRNSSELASRLSSEPWERILKNANVAGRAIFQYESNSASRPKLLADVASEICTQYGPAMLRQRSALSSFSLPRHDTDPNWKDAENAYQYPWFVPEERINIEAVASECRLIIDPEYFPKGYLKAIQKAKLETLRGYLAGADDDKVRVVFKRFTPAEGLTIIGNYWTLQSAAVAPSETKRQALSTWHAPTVDEYCKVFDEEFDCLWRDQEKRWKCGSLTSRSYAIVRIDCALDHLDC